MCFQMSPLQQHQTSPPPSPLPTAPLLTSTLLELDKPPIPLLPQSPFPEGTVNHCCHYGFSELSSISQVSLSLSSIHSSVLSSSYKESSTAVLDCKAEVVLSQLFSLIFFCCWLIIFGWMYSYIEIPHLLLMKWVTILSILTEITIFRPGCEACRASCLR